jgi:hypothetical protein
VSESELKNAIWCVGDSFTVGLGSPLLHTWPSRLAELSNRRTRNVSMDGASNEWIARTAQSIVNSICPMHMVIMWSYTHRRELNDVTLNVENRRLFSTNTSVTEDLDNLLECKKKIDSKIECMQFIVPGALPDVNVCWKSIAAPNWPSCPGSLAELANLPLWILSEIQNLHNCLDEIDRSLRIQNLLNFLPVEQQDWARDGHHFDLITAEWVATQAMIQLSR